MSRTLDKAVQVTEHAPTNYTPIIIIAGLIALAINGALVGWAFWYAAQQPHVSLSKPHIEDNVTLCPGDTLDYGFTLSVTKAADVDLYTTVDRALPPDHVSYTRLQQFNFDSQTDLEINRHWQLPPTYLDPVSGTQVAWLPGSYVQITRATVANGRDEAAHIEVPFVVKTDCGK